MWNVGLFRSVDAGATWTESDQGITDHGLQSLTGTAGAMLAVGATDGLFRSTDDGASWTAANASLPSVRYVAAPDVTSGIVYAATAQGVFKSVDGGATWGAANAGIETEGIGLLSVSASAPDIVWASSQDGLFVSHDAGATWSAKGFANLPSQSILSFTSWVADGNEYVLTTVDGTHLWLSSDGGGSFTVVPSGWDFVKSMAAFGAGPVAVFAGTGDLGLWEGLWGH